MSVRMFIALQLLMFSILILVGSQLLDVEHLLGGIVLNFAIFYITSMLVGYMVSKAPLANALLVCSLFYTATYFLGDASGFSILDQFIDLFTALVFVVAGTQVGIRSRKCVKGQDIIG